MLLKKTVLAIGALSVASVIGFTAFAASSSTPATTTTNPTTSSQCTRDGNRPPRPTDAQREEMKAKADASKTKFDSLTDAQKEELYAIKDKAIASEIQLIEKSLSLGVIDAATATEMKERLNEQKTSMREDDRLPLPGGKGMGRGHMGRDQRCDATTPAQ
jgi:hypothetical protein